MIGSALYVAHLRIMLCATGAKPAFGPNCMIPYVKMSCALYFFIYIKCQKCKLLLPIGVDWNSDWIQKMISLYIQYYRIIEKQGLDTYYIHADRHILKLW